MEMVNYKNIENVVIKLLEDISELSYEKAELKVQIEIAAKVINKYIDYTGLVYDIEIDNFKNKEDEK